MYYYYVYKRPQNGFFYLSNHKIVFKWVKKYLTLISVFIMRMVLQIDDRDLLFVFEDKLSVNTMSVAQGDIMFCEKDHFILRFCQVIMSTFNPMDHLPFACLVGVIFGSMKCYTFSNFEFKRLYSWIWIWSRVMVFDFLKTSHT